jgi:hypothetical protein
MLSLSYCNFSQEKSFQNTKSNFITVYGILQYAGPALPKEKIKKKVKKRLCTVLFYRGIMIIVGWN